MASDVIQQRFAGIFQSLDRNGDGYIDETDYEVVVATLAERQGVELGSPEANAIRDKINAGWESVRKIGDTDGDGRVTREEFASSLAALAEAPEGLERVGMAIADQMITMMDSDGDGRLNRDEFHDMMGAWGAPEEELGAVFGAIDSDGDGYVTREELLRSARGFYSDDSPAAKHLWSATEDGQT